MKLNHKPQVVVLGGNFAGLSTARFIHERCGDSVDITVIDRKPTSSLFQTFLLRC